MGVGGVGPGRRPELPGGPLALLRQVALRLRALHRAAPSDDADAVLRCHGCGEPWPCPDRRLADRSLLVVGWLPPRAAG